MKIENESDKNVYRNYIFLQFYSSLGLAGTQFWTTCKDIFKTEEKIQKIISMFPI